ncbi:MAG: rod shape-determining protein MreC [Neisseriaceae bacterium]|nr:rod shape-determining protein MreC [Neisseriaceae bacterium]
MSQNETHLSIQFILWITAAIVLLGIDVYSTWTRRAQEQVVDIAAPVRQFTGLPVTAMHNLTAAMPSANDIQHLTQENDRLSAQLMMLQSVEQDNIELKRLLDLKHYGITPITSANILATAGGTPAARMVIDKGASDGIEAGQAVIDGHGLIGQVTAVGKNYAQITPSNHRNSVIPVMIGRTGYRTLIYGTSEYLDLRYFPADQDIVEGDILLTSGIDNSYPAGIPVAKVSYIEPAQDGSPYLRVRTEFIGRILSARFVMILPRNQAPNEVQTEEPKPQAAVKEVKKDAPKLTKKATAKKKPQKKAETQ